MRSPIPIADCHGHVGLHPDFPAYKLTLEDMIQVMDLLNIEVLAITSTLSCYNDCHRGNSEVAKAIERYPTRFLGYVTVNPNPFGEGVEELEAWRHFHRPPLIKLHPATHKYPVNGKNYLPIWDYANRMRAVVLVHTWDSDPDCSPLLLGPIARQYPQARIIAGHSGVTWRGYEQSLEVAQSVPNVFLDITGSQAHRTIIEKCVKVIGSERILFGSDLPFLEAAAPVARVLTARISDHDKTRILRGNFLALISGRG